MLKIDIDGLTQFKDLAASLTAAQLRKAVRLGTNDTLRWSRTRIRTTIQEAYNIKAARINDTDSRKGLKLLLATTADPMNGRITAGHRPINLASLGRSRRTKTGVSVEVLKGHRGIIQRAFMIPGKNTVFARGRYSAFGFLFRGGIGERQNTTGNDTPISGINTVSVATAALNTRAFNKWEPDVNKKHIHEIERQISRLLRHGD